MDRTPVRLRFLDRFFEMAIFLEDSGRFNADVASTIVGENISISFKAVDSSFGKKRKRVEGSFQYQEHVKYLMSDANVSQSTLKGCAIELAASKIAGDVSTRRALAQMGTPIVTTSGPLAIAVATVDDDNDNLIFNKPGVPLCSSGEDCIAYLIEGPPSMALSAYRGPGHDPSSDCCILCIRHQLGMLVNMHKSFNGSAKQIVGLRPPFCNPVDVIGGYRSSFCAITPNDMHCISGGIWIMGPPVGFKKIYNPHTKLWVVDQSVAVFGAVDFFF